MYYYKTFDGNLVTLESRSVSIENLPDNTQQITKEAYYTEIAKMFPPEVETE